ncbi:MAG: endonuclease/exonuclease/phosphatase family protein [Sedimentisphaerales bacterium]|nr:endonuclease/exonuclease/phosphatase family protein [Sedimentisphaerales bacterium]
MALCAALFVAHANRRTPVEPQSGTGVHRPEGSKPVVQARFRVATYNIHRGKGTDGVRDLDRTADVLREADLVGLNEVGGPAFPGGSDQARQLGEALKIGWLFAPNQRRWYMYHFGNGLLSRPAVGPWTSEPLVYHEDRSRSHRNLLTASIAAGPQPVTVMVTHLDRGEIRPDQLSDVLVEFREHEPAILMGDFNTDATDPLLIELFADSNNVDAIGAALGDADQPGRIDWIITRGMTVLSGGMEPVGVSDHPCYWVDVQVNVSDSNAPSPP